MPQADEHQQQRPAVALSSTSVSQTPSSSSTNVASTPSNTSQSPTIDALLNATLNRDPLIALESILAERNSLAAQNVQLWKLIEKQRTMYNNATREIERLKASAERNGSSAGDTLAASTSSNTGRRAESQQRVDDRSQRAKVARTNSEDQAIQKQHLAIAQSSHTRSISPARSQDLRTNGTSESKLAPSNHAPNPPQRPTRGESLPTLTPPTVHASLPPSTNLPATVPLNVQKKSSITPLSTVPAPVPAVVVPIIETVSSTVTSPVATEPPVALVPALGGSLAPQPRDRRAARESRISLPDEAARYIAAMGDSPLGSPGFGNVSTGGTGDVGGSTEQGPQVAGFDIGSESSSGDAEATLRGGRNGNMEKEDHTPIPIAVSYPAAPERSPPPPPMVGNGHGHGHTPAHVHGYGHGTNGMGRNASFDYNDAATPMPTQLTYASQQQQYPMYSTQHQQPTHHQPPPPVRPQLHTQPSGSGGRPSIQQQMAGSVVSLPGSQLPSPAESTPVHSVHSEYSRDLREQYQAAQSIPGQNFRDIGFYDVGSQSPAQHPRNQYPSPSQPQPQSGAPPAPRLHPSQLGSTRVRIAGSNIRSNERGKDVLSFLISVFPPSTSHAHNQGADEWKVEKMYSDVLALDGSVRSTLGRSHAKKLPPLPDAKLFKDNAPAKVDQRKAILEQYLQALLIVPLKDPSDICAFFSTGLSRGDRAPVTSQGYKEGYLTKRGKNFGGWKTRYFVLQTSVLEYYENRGGTHLGSINIAGSQIGRQQKQASPDDENAYRHAFLIIEQGRKGTAPARHVLCAASDAERDEWVDVLVRSVAPVSGSAYGDDSYPQSDSTVGENVSSRPSTSSNAPSERGPENGTGNSPVDRGPGGLSDAQLAQRILERNAGSSASAYQGNVAPSSSLPSSLDHSGHPAYQEGRSNSSLGHYTESPRDHRGGNQFQMQDVSSPSSKSRSDRGTARVSYHPVLSTAKMSSSSHAPSSASTTTMADRDRDDSSAGESTTAGSVVGTGSKKISGPLNGQPIPAGYKFGGNKDGLGSGADASPVGGDRATKAKSGRFWPTFGKGNGNTNTSSNSGAYPPLGAPSSAAYATPGRAVFGVALESSLAIATIANLPAIVFRCIEYLEAKKAADEEGIYRLSGSSAVIKALKDRFNHDGDVNLLKHDEYWDPHAIAGLLKQFLRDLPTSILTRELQQRFLSVVDLMDSNERVNELAHLVSQLPVANYSLLRAMITHLILIVQNSAVNKMTMRNVGIVFSPTLGIPAGILSLMLGEFDRVFNVDATDGSSDAASSNEHDSYVAPQAERTPQQKRSSADRSTGRSGGAENDRINKRNSMMYNNTDTDRMLGLGGRKLEPPDESSDGEDVPMPEESDSDTDQDETSSGPQTMSEQTGSGSPPSPAPLISVSYPITNGDGSGAHTHMHGARAVAATRGLQISVGKGSHRSSGLPTSPRPNRYPGSPGQGG